MTASSKRRATHTHSDDLAVAGLGAITIDYLRAVFENDRSRVDRLVQMLTAEVLLRGVTAVLTASIDDDDKLQFLATLAYAFVPTTQRGAAAFVRGL